MSTCFSHVALLQGKKIKYVLRQIVTIPTELQSFTKNKCHHGESGNRYDQHQRNVSIWCGRIFPRPSRNFERHTVWLKGLPKGTGIDNNKMTLLENARPGCVAMETVATCGWRGQTGQTSVGHCTAHHTLCSTIRRLLSSGAVSAQTGAMRLRSKSQE